MVCSFVKYTIIYYTLFMDTLKHFLDIFFSFKPYVMLPLFMLVIAFIVRMRPADAFMSALERIFKAQL